MQHDASSPEISALLERLRGIVGERHAIADRPAMGGHVVDVLRSYDSAPVCLVEPGDTREVAEVVKACQVAGCAIVPIGGNTGLAGGAVVTREHPAILLGLRRLNAIGQVSADGGTLTVGAGCILANIQAAASAAGRLFPLGLTAEGSCQIGGNIATNAGGINALRYGKMRDLVLGLEVVLPDGQVLDMMRGLHKDNAGYDLKHVFIGSGGTLGVITGAVLKLWPAVASSATAFAAIPDIAAAQAVLAKMRARFGERITSAELMDRMSLDLVRNHAENARVPFARTPEWSLLIEIGDTHGGTDLQPELEAVLEECFEAELVSDATIARSHEQSEALWRLRHATSEVMRHAGTRFASDLSAPLESLQPFVDALIRDIAGYFPDARVCIFGHMGDGNLHVLVCFADRQPGPSGRVALQRDVETRLDAIVNQFGGSVTAEHGIGLSYRPRLAATRSPVETGVMRSIKQALDPHGLMNPGKVIPD